MFLVMVFVHLVGTLRLVIESSWDLLAKGSPKVHHALYNEYWMILSYS